MPSKAGPHIGINVGTRGRFTPVLNAHVRSDQPTAPSQWVHYRVSTHQHSFQRSCWRELLDHIIQFLRQQTSNINNLPSGLQDALYRQQVQPRRLRLMRKIDITGRDRSARKTGRRDCSARAGWLLTTKSQVKICFRLLMRWQTSVRQIHIQHLHLQITTNHPPFGRVGEPHLWHPSRSWLIFTCGSFCKERQKSNNSARA